VIAWVADFHPKPNDAPGQGDAESTGPPEGYSGSSFELAENTEWLYSAIPLEERTLPGL